MDWSALAKEWMDMSQLSQNAVMSQAPFQFNHLPLNDLYFVQQQQLQPPPPPQFNLYQRPPMHLNNFNLPNHLMNLNSQVPYPFVHNQPHLNVNHLQFNAPFNQNPPLINNTQSGPPPPLISPNFMQRKEPPLLPPFEPMIDQNFKNKFDHARNDFESNKFKDKKNDFKKDFSSKNLNIKKDFKEKMYDKKEINDKEHPPVKSFNKPQQSANNHLKFNQPASLKMNHLIPNQLDQEVSTADDAETSSNNSTDVNKKKSLPEWIRQGLEKMEKDKQKKIEKEEDLRKKAKEDQLRKELDNDEKGEEDDKEVKNDFEKKKIFSSSNLRTQKTFADMFLVKKGKDYYYENKEEMEKELVKTRQYLSQIYLLIFIF